MANVVITGGTRGLGRAMVLKFLEAGDRVALCSRSEHSVLETTGELEKKGEVFGRVCDIRDFASVKGFAEWCSETLGHIDFWINNAGVANSTKTDLVGIPEDEIDTVIRTNLIGTIYATKAALGVMGSQGSGHIFLMEGMGSNGRATPNLLPYGASKASMPQLLKTLLVETEGSGIGVHLLSPGVVLTDLLLENASLKAKKVFNILAEMPEVPATFLVERIRKVRGTGRRIRFLTRRKVMFRFLTAWRYKDRFFDEDGNLLVNL